VLLTAPSSHCDVDCDVNCAGRWLHGSNLAPDAGIALRYAHRCDP